MLIVLVLVTTLASGEQREYVVGEANSWPECFTQLMKSQADYPSKKLMCKMERT